MTGGAILAWGIDLGMKNSEAARLFDAYASDQQEAGTPATPWQVVRYGRNDNRSGLVLGRSLKYIDIGDEDKSVGEWLNVKLSGDGLKMASQPDDAELGILKRLVESVTNPGEEKRGDLVLTALCLPYYE